MQQLNRGVHKRYVQLLIDDHNLDVDPWPQGGELIYRYGIPSGRTTSAAYGYTLGCQVTFFCSLGLIFCFYERRGRANDVMIANNNILI